MASFGYGLSSVIVPADHAFREETRVFSGDDAYRQRNILEALFSALTAEQQRQVLEQLGWTYKGD